MNKKILSLLLGAVMAASLFSACGNKSAEKKNTTNNTKVEEKAETSSKEDDTKEVKKYADSSYIVDAEWLSKNLNNENLLILDARGEKAYKKGHIPGAIAATWQGFADMEGAPGDENWGVTLDAAKLSETFASIGVDKNKTIVVYADNHNGWGEDGRFVWMLRMAGVENAKILNGGIKFWTDSNYEISKEDSKPVPSEFKVEKLDNNYTADTEYIKANMDKIVIIDSREKDEYEGAAKFGEKRGGHLPNSKLFTFNKVFNADGTVKNQEELEKLFTEAGINKDDEIVTYCTAGIRSAHLADILRMAGYTKARNYDQSFYRWAALEELNLEK